jgi:hypothetical protein
MKREYRNAIQKAIKDSDLNGYKWTITKKGLRWSYCDVEFTFHYDPETNFLQVYDAPGVIVDEAPFIGLLIGDHSWDDAKDIEEAYYKATKATISKANYLY